MTSTIEFDLLLEGYQSRDVVGLCSGSVGYERGIQVVDIGLMVFLVVDFHDLLGDDGFEGLECKFVLTLGVYSTYVVGIGERRKSVSLGCHDEVKIESEDQMSCKREMSL